MEIVLFLLRLAISVHAAPKQPEAMAILERKCQPCHFQGGKMYAKLPFDEPETIYRLGEKLFTRIKDPHEREVIRAFLAKAPAPGKSGAGGGCR
jgi:hypothetical protein